MNRQIMHLQPWLVSWPAKRRGRLGQPSAEQWAATKELAGTHEMAIDDKPQAPHFLTVKETAAYLRLCHKQVRRLISRGELPAHKFGRALRIGKDDIDAYVAERRLNTVVVNT